MICLWSEQIHVSTRQPQMEDSGYIPIPFEETTPQHTLPKEIMDAGMSNINLAIITPPPILIEEPSVEGGVKGTSFPKENHYCIRKDLQKVLSEEIKDNATKMNEISIWSWNARSINHVSKLSFIQEQLFDIFCVQETWLNQESNLSGGFSRFHNQIEIIRFDREDQNLAHGGGTLTILKHSVITRQVRISPDYGFFKFSMRGHSIWMINVYLSRGTKQQIQELFLNINRYIPYEDLRSLIILGDFNVNLSKQSDRLDTLKALTKDLGLSIVEPSDSTRNGFTLDFVICHSSYNAVAECVNSKLSDHLALRISLKIPQTTKTPNIKILTENLLIAQLSKLSKVQVILKSS